MTDDLFENAKRYMAQGWALVAIPAGGKAPSTFGWQTKATPPDHWQKNPTHNMGLLHSLSGTCALDIDNLAHTKMIFKALNIDLDKILNQHPQIIGNPERGKILFRVPDGLVLNTHKINWPVQGNPKKREVVFELRAGQTQDILPPSIHPETQQPYRWAGASYEDMAEIPSQILHLWQEWPRFAPQMQDICPWRTAPAFSPKRHKRRLEGDQGSVIEAYNEAHPIQDEIEKVGYVQFGNRWLSPNSTSKIPGLVIFDDGRGYSHHASDPFGDFSFDAFEVFCQYEHLGNASAAVKAAAEILKLDKMRPAPSETERAEMRREIEHGGQVAAILMNFGKIKEPQEKNNNTPPHLLTVPGVLADMVKFSDKMAIKAQPQFDVQAALAFGSVVMGRRWVTDLGNMSSLFFLNIAKTGEGKDNAAHVVEKVLRESGLDLVGPAGYTSEGGVITSLKNRPCHIALIDEFGMYLDASRAKGSPHLQAANSMMMQAFGRLTGMLTTRGYSGATLTDTQRKAQDAAIQCPAISVMGMTTPETFYEAISGKDVASGLLNRFLIVESKRPRQRSRMSNRNISPPSNLIKWAIDCASAYDGEGMMAEGNGYEFPPAPIIVPFSKAARDLLWDYEGEIINRQNEKSYALGSMLDRNREIAMRVALIVSRSLEQDEVSEDATRWAVDYVDFYSQQTYLAFMQNMNEGEHDKLRKQTAEAIRAAGSTGLKTNELLKAVPMLGNLGKMQRENLFSVIEDDYPIDRQKQQPKSGIGRPSIVFLWKV